MQPLRWIHWIGHKRWTASPGYWLCRCAGRPGARGGRATNAIRDPVSELRIERGLAQERPAELSNLLEAAG
jgi:hypothetical protein